MTKQISASDFARAIEGLNIADRPAAMARAVLVEGKTQAEVARDEGVSRNAVCLAVNRVWEVHQDVPAGFERVTAILPKHRAEIVRQWQDAAQQQTETAR